MPASSDPRASDLDRLYGLPLDEFTAARDELARRLRTEGERDAAQTVKALRKPSLASWALNQISRQDPEGVAELLAAGERLRAAMTRLLAERDRGPLARATTEERQFVDRLAGDGERRLAAAGHPVSAAVHGKLVATLHAVASDAEARELLAAGRLVRDYETSDLGFGFAAAAPARPAKRPAEPAPDSKAAAARRAAAARQLRSLRRRLTDAQASDRERAAEAQAAGVRVDEARREAAREAAALERAQATLEQAQAALEQARTDAANAAEDVTRLQASVRELESSAG